MGMPRLVRIQHEGGIDHVMCRVDRREAIFADDGDWERFLGTLGQMGAGRTGAVLVLRKVGAVELVWRSQCTLALKHCGAKIFESERRRR